MNLFICEFHIIPWQAVAEFIALVCASYKGPVPASYMQFLSLDFPLHPPRQEFTADQAAMALSLPNSCGLGKSRQWLSHREGAYCL